MSNQTVRILTMLLEKPDTPFFGLEITKATGLKSGTVYPALARLEATGWLRSQWEPGDPAELGRPLRRMYQLTGIGISCAPTAIDRFLEGQKRPKVVGRRGLLDRDPKPRAI